MGGLQVCFSGDFFQLPPVPESSQGVVSSDTRATRFCFQCPVWKDLIQEVHILKQVYRQRDPDFIEILDAIRWGSPLSNFTRSIKLLQLS
jgi:ATP-dependent DNA helicase PIF1